MSEISMIFARKINKIPEFYMVFARKAEKYFSRMGRGRRGATAPCPVSYAHASRLCMMK